MCICETILLSALTAQVPAPGCPPASDDQMRELLAGLRALQAAYYRSLVLRHSTNGSY